MVKLVRWLKDSVKTQATFGCFLKKVGWIISAQILYSLLSLLVCLYFFSIYDALLFWDANPLPPWQGNVQRVTPLSRVHNFKGGGGLMKPSRNQCANGTWDPNFRIKFWISRSIFPKSNKKEWLAAISLYFSKLLFDLGKKDLSRITHTKFHPEIQILSAICVLITR